MSRTPRRDDIKALSWLVSRRVWMGTAVFGALLLAAISGVGVVYGHPIDEGITTLSQSPPGALAVFLAARGLALYTIQGSRDRVVRERRLGTGADPSVVAMLTVASFSIVGLIAAVTVLPPLLDVSGLHRWVAIGIAAISVTVSYPMLVYQLAEKVAADRYRRGYRVSTAVWAYLWTLPLVLVAYHLLVYPGDTYEIALPEAIAIPSVTERVGQTLTVGPWDLALVALATPTVLTFWYVVRRQVEGLYRGALEGLAGGKGP